MKKDHWMYLSGLSQSRMIAALAFCVISIAASASGWAATGSSGSDGANGPGPNAGIRSDERPPTAAVYLSIKQPKSTFVLATTRPDGGAYRDVLTNMAKARDLDIVLPVTSDLLQEAMMAVRIAIHDSKGLRAIATMQGAGIVLAGRLVDTGGEKGWQVTWSIDNVIGRLRWGSRSESYEAAIADGLDVLLRVMSGELEVTRHPLPKLRPLIQEDIEARQANPYRERDLESGMENVQ